MGIYPFTHGTLEWNTGMEHWTGTLDWNTGMTSDHYSPVENTVARTNHNVRHRVYSGSIVQLINTKLEGIYDEDSINYREKENSKVNCTAYIIVRSTRMQQFVCFKWNYHNYYSRQH